MTGMAPQGVGMQVAGHSDVCASEAGLAATLSGLGLAGDVELATVPGAASGLLTARLRPEAFARLCPDFDTLHLAERLGAVSGAEAALQREVWVALLSAPLRMDFASLAELQAHVQVRCNIARAAEKTALAFKTNDAAERPEAFWRHEDEVGFLLQPQVSLIDALVAATQPERTGRLYDFSCYRASEYVILLGLAQEARRSSPAFYDSLEASARHTCIKSGRFHEVFLVEYGSMDAPVPPRYYVPGDRVWFKNPDPHSSDASGYEGSWVIYMGAGLFSNFWKRDQPFTLEAKALEVYHWRHGAYVDAQGEMQIDETVVEDRVRGTEADPQARAEVLARMERLRDPTGVYAQGGCIDATREFPRQLGQIELG